MKRYLITPVFIVFLLSCSSSKSDYTYLDVNNNEISKSKFEGNRRTNQYLEIQNDSLKQKKLIERTKTGKIENLDIYRSLISNKSEKEIDASKPIVVIYHPGKDACNSSGNNSPEVLRNWYETLENGVQQLDANTPVYIYKDKEGLENFDGIINWYKDPDGLTEKLFFKHHYPCKSFVVLAPSGDYLAYYGEFSKEYLWNAINLISE